MDGEGVSLGSHASWTFPRGDRTVKGVGWGRLVARIAVWESLAGCEGVGRGRPVARIAVWESLAGRLVAWRDAWRLWMRQKGR
jgi:hypothetical protein